jgi:hypothetical protein
VRDADKLYYARVADAGLVAEGLRQEEERSSDK